MELHVPISRHLSRTLCAYASPENGTCKGFSAKELEEGATSIYRMPVALTDHIDRNPDVQLLRGKIGFIHSWVLHGDDEASATENSARVLQNLPLAVLVRYRCEKWQLPGLKSARFKSHPAQARCCEWS